MTKKRYNLLYKKYNSAEFNVFSYFLLAKAYLQNHFSHFSLAKTCCNNHIKSDFAINIVTITGFCQWEMTKVTSLTGKSD